MLSAVQLLIMLKREVKLIEINAKRVMPKTLQDSVSQEYDIPDNEAAAFLSDISKCYGGSIGNRV
jgi:hypothetical protein